MLTQYNGFTFQQRTIKFIWNATHSWYSLKKNQIKYLHFSCLHVCKISIKECANSRKSCHKKHSVPVRLSAVYRTQVHIVFLLIYFSITNVYNIQWHQQLLLYGLKEKLLKNIIALKRSAMRINENHLVRKKTFPIRCAQLSSQHKLWTRIEFFLSTWFTISIWKKILLGYQYYKYYDIFYNTYSNIRKNSSHRIREVFPRRVKRWH